MKTLSRVFILNVFILTNREPHRYPEFSIYPIEAFCFLSLEDCVKKIPYYIPNEELYCFVVELHCCGIDLYALQSRAFSQQFVATIHACSYKTQKTPTRTTGKSQERRIEMTIVIN